MLRVALLLAAFAPGLALAQTPAQPEMEVDGESPFNLNLAIDIPLLALGIGGTATQWIAMDPPACLPNCDTPDINAFDAVALGRYNPDFRLASDIGMTAVAVAPVIIGLVDTGGGDGWAEDMTIYLQSIFLAQGIAQVSKHLFARNAPYVYENHLSIQDREGGNGAFPSGHTALAVAAATTYGITYWMRHPDDPHRWTILLVGEALALGVGVLKVLAGSHYPTDVVGGAVIGGLVGALVPLAHTW